MLEALHTSWSPISGLTAAAPVCFAVDYRNQAKEGRT